MKRISGLGKWAVLVIAGFIISACSGVNTLFKPASVEPTAIPVVQANAAVIAEGRVVPSRYLNLAFPVNGRLVDLTVAEGDEVEKDALLATLDDSGKALTALRSAEYEKESAQQALDDLNENADMAASQAGLVVAQAQTDLTVAQKAFDDTQTRDFRDRLDARETTLQDRKETLDDRKTTLDKYTNLDVNNATRVSAQDSYDAALEDYNRAVFERDQLANQRTSAQNSLDEALQRLKKAHRDLDKLATGPDPDQLAQAQKRLDAAQAQLDAAQHALDDLELHAPFAGLAADVKPLEAGGVISFGQTILVLADISGWFVETTDLTELDVVGIKKGDAVTIKLDALPEDSIQGEVVSVAQSYTEKSGDILYQVRIRLDNPPEELRWGMTASVSFGVR